MTAPTAPRVTMTFLFTDIEGSTRLWDRHPEHASQVIERHDRLVEEAVGRHGGEIFHRAGDGMIARFDNATDAANAAIDLQRSMADAEWSETGPVRVRTGVHTGSVVVRQEGPYGWALNFGARLTDLGHGGQIIVSDRSVELLEPASVDGIELRDLGEQFLRDIARPARVYSLLAPGLARDFPPLRKSLRPRSQVPDPRSPIIGRAGDLAAVLEHGTRSRNVTITGTSGVGKTRLAIEVAATRADAAGRMVLWCDLGGVKSGSVVAAIMTAHAISQRPDRAPLPSLTDYLAERSPLVVLDGCDECLDDVVELIGDAMASAPGVEFLCTSQRVIGVPGEVVHRLAPLPIEHAVELFVDRAVAAGVRGTDRADEICRLVDGLPFGIELVAAAAATFAPGELIEALRSDGLAVVDANSDIARSVERAVSFGVQSLTSETRQRLVAASIFPGQFDRDMFRSVCAPDAEPSSVSASLLELVDASLLQPDPSGERATFRLLDPIRTYVAGLRDDAFETVVRERLRGYVLDASAAAAAGLRGPDETRWLRTLDRQFETWRAVLERALESDDLETASRLATDQWEWAFFRYNSEYFAWGARVIERFDHTGDGRLAGVHGVVALGHWFRDEIGPTFDHGRRALELEQQADGAFSLPARLAMINATVFAGADAPPDDVFAEATAYHLQRPEGFYRMNVEAQNAIMASWFGETEIAEHRAVKALRIARASGNPTSIAYGLWVLGQAIISEDPDRGEQLIGEALLRARDVDNRWTGCLAQTALASSRRRTAGPVAAAPLLVDLIDQLTTAGHWAQFWNVVRIAALVVGKTDDELAIQLIAAVDTAELKFPGLPHDVQAVDELRARILDRRGPVWCDRSRRLGSTWDLRAVADAARSGVQRVIDRA